VTDLLQTIFYPLLSPIASAHQKIEQKKMFLQDLPSIYEQNQTLRSENQNLKLTLKKANEEQKVLGFSSSYTKVIPLRLVGEGSDLLFTTKDILEVEVGQPVIIDHNLIGIVKEVSTRLIKVLPITSPAFKLPIQLENNLKGNYLVEKDNPLVTSLPSDFAYSPNTLVLTLPSDQMPENLVIGEIDQVISASADPFQKAKVKISKPSSGEYLLILKP
jgi:cell shape-determining protein MreC